MKLVEEIIEMASDGRRPLADALRKCLVLSFALKNEKLKNWVEKELNGYDRNDDVPQYRLVNLHSKGNFTGPAGAFLRQRPLPLSILDKKHRGLLVSKLTQPIAAYDSGKESVSEINAAFNWPPDLIVHYQGKFISGYALSQAWQELPGSVLVGLCEEVRNRLLRFALEIKEELGNVEDKSSTVPQERIEAAVVNYIYGGMNVIGGKVEDFSQIGNIIVPKGDFGGLSKALKTLDVSNSEIAKLKNALDGDGQTVGNKTKGWLMGIGKKLGGAGLKVGTGVATEIAKEWLLQYCGLKP